MDLVDFNSQDGFFQAAGKKKKKQTTAFNWLADEGDKKDDDGTEGGGDGNKDQNGGDSGTGDGSGSAGGNGGDDGDKKDGKGGEEANPDDIWDFTPVSSKKKNKAKTTEAKATDAFGLPDIPSTDFHEIKLDDTGGGGDSLDLSFDPKPEKITAGISAWTPSWTTGSWGWGGVKSPTTETPRVEKPKSPDPVVDNPWKPKNKTTFNFGALDQDEEKKDDAFDFLGAASKPSERKNLGGFSWGATSTAKTGDDDFWGSLSKNKSADDKPKEEKPAATEEAADDVWGWASAKKDVGVHWTIIVFSSC